MGGGTGVQAGAAGGAGGAAESGMPLLSQIELWNMGLAAYWPEQSQCLGSGSLHVGPV